MGCGGCGLAPLIVVGRGDDGRQVLGEVEPEDDDPVAVVGVLGSRAADGWEVDLPEPLASVIDYLSEELFDREFVPTAELVGALEVEPTAFAREMGDLGCRPTRQYIPDGDSVRRVRGYLTAEIRVAVEKIGPLESG